MKRVGFLFNHDAAHQIAHIAGIAGALATARRDVTTVVLYSRPKLRAAVEALVGFAASARIQWVRLETSTATRALAPLADRVLPFTRLMALRQNLDLFAGLDLLVSTERTCLRIKDRLGARAPGFVYVPHGAGDRNVAYHPDLKRFDLFLVPGRKLVDAAREAGILTGENWRIIGYPKFDAIDTQDRPKLFDNPRPTFLYNPHFDPKLSSWFDFGPALIRHFAAHPELGNLVVAPHVMLFRKKLHVSPEYRIARFRPDIPTEAHAAPNILIDTSSPRLFDMHYTRAADVYIGDASSQVYEFIVNPRACFFLDSHNGWALRHTENYRMWAFGPVASSMDALAEMLPDWRLMAKRHAAIQAEQFAYTVDRNRQPAGLRGALALIDCLGLTDAAESAIAA